MASYILRGIDPDLWRRFKSQAALKGLTLRALVESLITDWLTSEEK